MTMDSTRAGAAAPGSPQPIGPAPFVRIVMGPMTKKLNRVMVRFAGRRHFTMAAQIKHIGRRSGKVYVTPVSARLVGDVAVLPLTFGNQSDWAWNVHAAGGCTIRFDGLDYIATEPEFLSRAEAKPLISAAFSAPQWVMLRALGIKQFLHLRVSQVEG
jgi:deazaflavin-dependent oxidoreductase (nitroreductase family)